MGDDRISVTTHVGRDVLQSAQLFQTVEAAVWEYIVNSLEYVSPDTRPEVQVLLDNRRRAITISDNGRGMDSNGLQHYFTMHAENKDRRRGVPGRGKFGTGKSAAFGIGRRLEVATVKDGRRNVIELTREVVDASEGSEIPVDWKVRNEPAAGTPNGTVVTIDGISARRLSIEPLIRLVERHLALWRSANPVVMIGSHKCEPWQPDIAESQTFRPSESASQFLGAVELVIHVARVPLDVGYRGVAVTAGPGNLVALETAAIDAKEFGNYLFGEIDVPALEVPSDDGTVTAYDSSRSLRLNYSHPVAGALLAFVGSSLDAVRLQLVEKHRAARREEETRRLSEAGREIAELLNQDLDDVAQRLNEMRDLQVRSGAIAKAGGGGEDSEDFSEGGSIPGILDRTEPRARTAVPTVTSGVEDPGQRRGQPDEEGADDIQPLEEGKKDRRKRGGISVEFGNLGEDEERSHYDTERKVILINLDHPMVDAAKGAGGIEDPSFRRLAYEIAFTQYALAIAREVYERDPAITADDALFEVRDALRRVTAKAASLYTRL